MTVPASSSKRPLSPHLQVYRLPLTAMMSITHRATGIANIIGLLVMTWWLVSLSNGPDAYTYFLSFADSIVGKIVLLGWTWSIFYHLCNGVRHLFWDAGYLFEIKNAYIASCVVLATSLALTAMTWLCVLTQLYGAA